MTKENQGLEDLQKEFSRMKAYLTEKNLLEDEKEFKKRILMNQNRIIEGLNQIGEAVLGKESEEDKE